MNNNRLKQLFKFLEEDPNDAFTLYAIATEYIGTEPNKALDYYEKLLIDHPDYIGTYYHAANLYNDFNRKEKAEEVYSKGIQLATEQNNSLALRELQNAYNEFLFEE